MHYVYVACEKLLNEPKISKIRRIKKNSDDGDIRAPIPNPEHRSRNLITDSSKAQE